MFCYTFANFASTDSITKNFWWVALGAYIVMVNQQQKETKSILQKQPFDSNCGRYINVGAPHNSNFFL